MTIFEIPEQVWFLAAFGALMVLLADTAMRSWRSPERVADPAFIWPRPAPVRSDVLIGPRLPGGSLTMPEPGLRYAVTTGGHAYFESVAAHPVPRPPLVVVPPAGAAFWSQVEGGAPETYQDSGEVIDTPALGTPVVHESATEEWSPLDEIGVDDEAHEALPLSLDEDSRAWLSERLARYDAAIAAIEGDAGRACDLALSAFQQASFALPAYRRRWTGSIEDTGEINGREFRSALTRV